MHRVDRRLAEIHFAYDHDNLYIRLDFENKKGIELNEKLRYRLTLFTPEPKLVEFQIDPVKKAGEGPGYHYALENILEIAVERSFIFDSGSGHLGLQVSVIEGDSELETWPETDAITFELPEKNKEMFWPQ